MNSNTIKGFVSGSKRNQIATLNVSTTTETAFSLVTDSGTAVCALAVPLASDVLGSGNPLGVNGNSSLLTPGGAPVLVPNVSDRPYFNSASFDGHPIRVRLAGTFTSGVATNDIKIGLYLGTSATLASDTALSSISTGTSGNFGVVSGNFVAEFLFIWDSTSQVLNGKIDTGLIGPSGVAPTVTALAATTQATSVASPSALSFIPTAKWNAANAGNTVTLTEFSLSLA